MRNSLTLKKLLSSSSPLKIQTTLKKTQKSQKEKFVHLAKIFGCWDKKTDEVNIYMTVQRIIELFPTGAPLYICSRCFYLSWKLDIEPIELDIQRLDCPNCHSQMVKYRPEMLEELRAQYETDKAKKLKGDSKVFEYECPICHDRAWREDNSVPKCSKCNKPMIRTEQETEN